MDNRKDQTTDTQTLTSFWLQAFPDRPSKLENVRDTEISSRIQQVAKESHDTFAHFDEVIKDVQTNPKPFRSHLEGKQARHTRCSNTKEGWRSPVIQWYWSEGKNTEHSFLFGICRGGFDHYTGWGPFPHPSMSDITKSVNGVFNPPQNNAICNAFEPNMVPDRLVSDYAAQLAPIHPSGSL